MRGPRRFFFLASIGLRGVDAFGMTWPAMTVAGMVAVLALVLVGWWAGPFTARTHAAWAQHMQKIGAHMGLTRVFESWHGGRMYYLTLLQGVCGGRRLGLREEAP